MMLSKKHVFWTAGLALTLVSFAWVSYGGSSTTHYQSPAVSSAHAADNVIYITGTPGASGAQVDLQSVEVIPPEGNSVPEPGTQELASTPGYNLVGVGDSVLGPDCECVDFLQVSASELETHSTVGKVNTNNLGIGGLTSSELVDVIDEAEVSYAIAQSDATVVVIGANDFARRLILDDTCLEQGSECQETGLTELRINIDTIVSKAQRLQAAHGGRLLLIGYWNVLSDGVVGQTLGPDYIAKSLALTRRVNAIMAQAANNGSDMNARVSYVDLDGVFHAQNITELLESDGDHPNGAGHRVIGKTLARWL